MEDESLTKRERQRQRRLMKEEQTRLSLLQRKRKRRYYVFTGLAVVVVLLLGAIFLFQSLSDDDDTDANVETTTTIQITTTQETEETEVAVNYMTFTEEDYGQGECPPADLESPVLDFEDTPALCLDLDKEYEAVFTTSEGVVRVRLDAVNTPGTANNFATLARYGYYDGTLLFRTDPSIGIIQGGSPHTNDNADRGPGYTIRDEGTDFKYVPGQLVMARTSAPNSASAQFFFAVNEQTSLLDGQGTYVVFGETTEGLEVLEAVLALNEDSGGGLGGAPSRNVVVEKIEILEIG